MVNRTQALVLGFFFVAWLSLAAVLVVAPEVYDQALQLLSGDHRSVGLLFLGTIAAFILLLGVGVLKRWRWTFWLIVVAFILGVLRVPASILELTGALPATSPTWYVVLQAFIGLVQFSIGLAMLAGYRRAGAWGAF